MNLVDSCGWLEYFADGANAGFFAPAIEDVEHLLVPSICVLEVFKRVLQQRDENDAIRAAAMMRQGDVVDLDATIAMDAARLGVRHSLPLADSVILATAQAHSAEIWTQDADFEGLPGVHYVRK
jgi:predicted nucleic acid-binding protein